MAPTEYSAVVRDSQTRRRVPHEAVTPHRQAEIAETGNPPGSDRPRRFFEVAILENVQMPHAGGAQLGNELEGREGEAAERWEEGQGLEIGQRL